MSFHIDAVRVSENRVQAFAAQKLAEIKSRPYEERIAARRAAADEEYASEAGVITLEQADATFIDLNIHADDTVGESFALVEKLEFGEIPVWKLRTEFPVRVQVGHLAGTPPGSFFQTNQSGTQVTPFQYTSDEFLVPNLVTANYKLEAFQEKEIALERVARDMRLARQKIIVNTVLGQAVLNPIATSLASYVGGTPFSGKSVYVLDAGVDAGSVPTTNIISLTSEGGLTREVFKKQQTYANLASRDLGRMFIPLSGAPWEAYWDQASIVALADSEGNQNPGKAITPQKWEEVSNTVFQRKGLYLNWFGVQLWVQPTNILPEGYFITSTNRPACLVWDQYTASQSNEETIFGNRAFNRRFEARSIATAQPDPYLLNFIVGQFNS